MPITVYQDSARPASPCNDSQAPKSGSDSGRSSPSHNLSWELKSRSDESEPPPLSDFQGPEAESDLRSQTDHYPAPAPKRSIPCLVILGDKNRQKATPEDSETNVRLKKALSMLDQFSFTFLDDHRQLVPTLVGPNPPFFILNFCDDGYMNDAFMELNPPALMDMMKIPYTGNAPDCLALCYNKANVRAIAKEMGLKVPTEIWIDPSIHTGPLPPVQFPAMLKPACGDGSVGITKDAVVHDVDALTAYLEKLKTTMPGIPVLVQEFLPGREFGVAVLGGGDHIETLPVLEVDYSELPKDLPQILGFESKWEPDSPYGKNIRYIEARLDEETRQSVVDAAISFFRRLKCRDYARFDFRMNAAGEIKLLEVNPNPAWVWDGKLAIMAGFKGWGYHQLLEKILTSAMRRYPDLAKLLPQESKKTNPIKSFNFKDTKEQLLNSIAALENDEKENATDNGIADKLRDGIPMGKRKLSVNN